MPRDTNTHGDIFGGWLMSQMDLAGGVADDGAQPGAGRASSGGRHVLEDAFTGVLGGYQGLDREVGASV